jgi:hypothetical protein
MKKLILLLCLLAPACCFALAKGDSVSINYFVVKENPFGQDEVAIVATDSSHNNTLSNIDGHFLFTINGFDDTLIFNKGVAFYDHKLTRSGFIYARHENEKGTHSMLYYIYKSESKLFPVHISWVVLIAIPVVLVLLGYMFRKFIIVAVIIFLVFVYFNYHSGLSVGTFFSSVIDGLRSMF